MGEAGLGETVRLLVLTAALTVVLAVTAGTARAESLIVKHKPWHTMTKHQKVIVLRKQIHKDRCVIRFWKHHRDLASATATLSYKARTQTHWARVSMRIAGKHLHSLTAASHYVASGGIAHEALWICIHNGEGAWNDNTGNGYYGGLQMTSGWGGVKRPDLLTPYEQMALAERQYRASHYSRAWLGQQWPNTSPPCLGYA